MEPNVYEYRCIIVYKDDVTFIGESEHDIKISKHE